MNEKTEKGSMRNARFKAPFSWLYRKRTSIKVKEGEREKKGREEDEKRTRRRETNLVVTL